MKKSTQLEVKFYKPAQKLGTFTRELEKHFCRFFTKFITCRSISGAPKPKTVEIIKEAEKYDRGFYTGIFGIFDGEELDSGVAIRFIEHSNNEFWYKSGGGITHQSNLKEEYIELLIKSTFPLFESVAVNNGIILNEGTASAKILQFLPKLLQKTNVRSV